MVCVFFGRYYVIHHLSRLSFLDSRPVTNNERTEAKRVGAFMQVVRPDDEMVSVIVTCTVLYLLVCFFLLEIVSLVKMIY